MAVVFPPPPPTHNTLSVAQRSQLLRTNAKLGQVLGSTPHILDEACTLSRSRLHSSNTCRGSIDSQTSSRTNSSTPRSSSEYTHPTSSSSTLSSDLQHHSERSWRVRFPLKRPPILRVGKSSPLPEPTPKTQLKNSRANQSCHFPDSDYSPLSDSTPRFAIPSEASMRRQKMRRLTKKLGEGVPMHLVFPPVIEMESDEDEVLVNTPVSECSVSSEESEKEYMWERHSARRSRFVQPQKVATVFTGKYVVHYHDTTGTHGLGAETFAGLKCGAITTIPEED